MRSFDQILRDVREARDWYAELRINTAGTRLEAIEHRVASLLADMGSLPPEELVEHWSNVDTYYALSDGLGFGKIAREIARVGPNLLPRNKLRTILEGPVVPGHETSGDGSVNARNLFTELELASALSECGIPAIGFDDLQFRLRGIEFSIEIKRLLSPRRVPDNIEEAYGQLQRRLRTDQHRGLIALALDKVMGLEGQILRIEPGDTPNQSVLRGVQDFDRRFQRPRQTFVDTRVIGLLLIVRFLCFTVSHNVIGPAYYLVIRPLISLDNFQHSDRSLLYTLAAQLTSTRS